MKIAIIPAIGTNPNGHPDYLLDALIDGFFHIKAEGKIAIELVFPSYGYPYPSGDLTKYKLSEADFISFAGQADLIILMYNKYVNEELAGKISRWNKTVLIDASEPGKNDRLDPKIRSDIMSLVYKGKGAVRVDLLGKCALYFRREKPYGSHNGKDIVPFPFGVQDRFVEYKPGVTKKDIDFVCIFGQDQYPVLRRQVRETLKEFCKREGFTYRTKQTGNIFFNIYTRFAQKKLYKIFARAKVGVSVSGGGFDTLRFWEILGNNCMLMTENIDIYEEGSKALDYKRITQFKDLDDFKAKLKEVATFLRNSYDEAQMQRDMADEYRKIMNEHSGKARAMAILKEAVKKGLIKNIS